MSFTFVELNEPMSLDYYLLRLFATVIHVLLEISRSFKSRDLSVCAGLIRFESTVVFTPLSRNFTIKFADSNEDSFVMQSTFHNW
jgi:hypothetical protein